MQLLLQAGLFIKMLCSTVVNHVPLLTASESGMAICLCEQSSRASDSIHEVSGSYTLCAGNCGIYLIPSS